MAQAYRGGRPIGTGWPHRPTPHEVRSEEFAPRRCGADPDQVRDFQHRIAEELTTLHREIRTVREENDRLRRVLRDWQLRHARPTGPAPEQYRNNTGHWPTR
ncbi:cell division protein DivIVA [Solwaraspora sp. WMMD1047]|uniref:DivIVA domain-containing protein n=1 Tax=Solwaraspora sp. WMMD1047 TaxID=3016102 RepID=UPI0024161EB5|nr:cell division protein DivIVA [Solwaraspora sp. WMMD1047]MDG4830937.1 cell division protein DivIVA [Solwaraspora sp. WMMD1047]